MNRGSCKDAFESDLPRCASCGHNHIEWPSGPGVCPMIGCNCKVWVEPKHSEDADIPRCKHGFRVDLTERAQACYDAAPPGRSLVLLGCRSCFGWKNARKWKQVYAVVRRV